MNNPNLVQDVKYIMLLVDENDRIPNTNVIQQRPQQNIPTQPQTIINSNGMTMSLPPNYIVTRNGSSMDTSQISTSSSNNSSPTTTCELITPNNINLHEPTTIIYSSPVDTNTTASSNFLDRRGQDIRYQSGINNVRPINNINGVNNINTMGSINIVNPINNVSNINSINNMRSVSNVRNVNINVNNMEPPGNVVLMKYVPVPVTSCDTIISNLPANPNRSHVTTTLDTRNYSGQSNFHTNYSNNNPNQLSSINNNTFTNRSSISPINKNKYTSNRSNLTAINANNYTNNRSNLTSINSNNYTNRNLNNLTSMTNTAYTNRNFTPINNNFTNRRINNVSTINNKNYINTNENSFNPISSNKNNYSNSPENNFNHINSNNNYSNCCGSNLTTLETYRFSNMGQMQNHLGNNSSITTGNTVASNSSNSVTVVNNLSNTASNSVAIVNNLPNTNSNFVDVVNSLANNSSSSVTVVNNLTNVSSSSVAVINNLANASSNDSIAVVKNLSNSNNSPLTVVKGLNNSNSSSMTVVKNLGNSDTNAMTAVKTMVSNSSNSISSSSNSSNNSLEAINKLRSESTIINTMNSYESGGTTTTSNINHIGSSSTLTNMNHIGSSSTFTNSVSSINTIAKIGSSSSIIDNSMNSLGEESSGLTITENIPNINNLSENNESLNLGECSNMTTMNSIDGSEGSSSKGVLLPMNENISTNVQTQMTNIYLNTTASNISSTSSNININLNEDPRPIPIYPVNVEFMNLYQQVISIPNGKDLLNFLEDRSKEEVERILDYDSSILERLRDQFISTGFKNKKKPVGSNEIPRPLNAFMIYRRHMIEQLNPYHLKVKYNDMHADIAKYWHNEPQEVKNQYKLKSNIHVLIHSKLFPNYKYIQTKGKNKNNSKYDKYIAKKLKKEVEPEKRAKLMSKLSKKFLRMHAEFRKILDTVKSIPPVPKK